MGLAETIWYKGTEVFRGRELVCFCGGATDMPGVPLTTFYLDPNRGFLLTRIVVKDSSGTATIFETLVTDVKKCSGNRWFPMRIVKPCLLDRDTQAKPTIEISVTKLELDETPDESEFSIVIPEDAHIRDASTLGSQIRMDETARYSLTDLPALYQRTQDAVARFAERESQRGRPEARSTWSRVVFWNVCAMVVLFVGFMIRRRWLQAPLSPK